MIRTLTGICLAVVWVVSMSPTTAQEMPTARVVTLQDAIMTALANNNEIEIARQRVSRGAGQVRETRAAGLPQVGVQAQALRSGPVPTVTLPGPDDEEQTFELGSPTTVTATLGASQVIDANRRVSTAVDITESAALIERYNLARTQQQVVFDVQNAYYGVLRAEAQRGVAHAAVDTAEERLRIAQAQFEAGTLPRFDVASAEVEVANRRQTLISAATSISISKVILLAIMGVDPAQPIAVVDVAIPIEPAAITPEQAAELAIGRRPEMLAAGTAVELQRQSVEFARRERIPALAAVANYNYDATTSLFRPERFSWVIGFNASVPVFDGGAISARVDQARSDLAAAQATLDQTALVVSLEVANSLLNLTDAYQRIQTAGQNVTLAEEALRLAQVRYQAGITLQVEVTDAETALTQARTNFVNAQYDYATALADYQRATATQPQIAQAPVSEERPL